ncbi:MAG: ATP-dependent Clp protease adaptor ClpS [Treponemataceae bacterium]
MATDSRIDRENNDLIITDMDDSVELPPSYHIIFYNDDFTSMDFVVDVLQSIFQKSSSEAEKLMMIIHNSGSAAVAIYPFYIAETKIRQVRAAAEKNGYPLRCEMEKI